MDCFVVATWGIRGASTRMLMQDLIFICSSNYLHSIFSSFNLQLLLWECTADEIFWRQTLWTPVDLHRVSLVLFIRRLLSISRLLLDNCSKSYMSISTSDSLIVIRFSSFSHRCHLFPSEGQSKCLAWSKVSYSFWSQPSNLAMVRPLLKGGPFELCRFCGLRIVNVKFSDKFGGLLIQLDL